MYQSALQLKLAASYTGMGLRCHPGTAHCPHIWTFETWAARGGGRLAGKTPSLGLGFTQRNWQAGSAAPNDLSNVSFLPKQ